MADLPFINNRGYSGRDHDQEARILRDRAAARNAARSNASSNRPATGAARILVSIFEETSIPTGPGMYYAAHPAILDCPTEAAGATCTPVVDTSTTIYPIVLHGTPAVGDLLVATHVGGRWVCEKTGTPKFCVSDYCSGPLAGAVVTLADGSGATAWSCTAGDDGCCTSTPPPGDYTAGVVLDGTTIYSGPITVGGGSGGIAIGGPGTDTCCSNKRIPRALTITGVGGTTPFVLDASNPGGGTAWYACQTFEAGGVVASGCAGGFGGDPGVVLGSGSVAVTYLGQCTDGGEFAVTAYWWTTSYDPDTAATCPGLEGALLACPWTFGCAAPVCAYVTESTGAGYVCDGSQSPGNNSATLARAPDDDATFAWSGTLVPSVSAGCPVPSLSVAVSA